MEEIIKIKARYEKRKSLALMDISLGNFYFSYFMCRERELKYHEILRKNFNDPGNIKLIEIGAGNGDNLIFFHRAGIKWKNIYANELLDDRFEILKERLPASNLIIGNALDLNFESTFDIVFQSTVFSSILDDNFKKELAGKMFSMTKKGGLMIWYDFKYNNPNNPDVGGIKKNEIIKLFPEAKKIKFHNVTLAPPIGRVVGKMYSVYNNLMPFLRTHIIAEIYK